MDTQKNVNRMQHNLNDATLFEVSWEVCNKVGGIYAVVSSKVLEATAKFGDNYYMLGPDMGDNAGFEETQEECWEALRPAFEAKGLACRLGRWDIPGRPKVILLRFKDKLSESQLLFELWNNFGVDSLSGGWDYIEPVMFSTVCGEVIATASAALKTDKSGPILAHFHEWMCGAGLLYLKKYMPEVGTVFTTHATVLGRSMAGSGFDIYKQMTRINPKQAAGEYDITAKCSMETASAQHADIFTTVGRITADESALFLGRTPDVLTLNGLDLRVIEDYSLSRTKPNAFRKRIFEAAGKLLRQELPADTKILVISGRYEYHNKGIDIFMDALSDMKKSMAHNSKVLVLCSVMGGHSGVNMDAISGDPSKQSDQGAGWISSHYVNHDDNILSAARRLGLDNPADSNVNFIFIPALLDGKDGFLNMTYYDMLSACDLGVFPSWYEPWGYTPQESIAYAVPTITTDLSGFGIWVRETEGVPKDGVTIVPRRKTSYDSTRNGLKDVLLEYSAIDQKTLLERRKTVRTMAEECSWQQFFPFYLHAYALAVEKVSERLALGNTFDEGEVRLMAASNSEMPMFHSFTAVAELPPELTRLRELANNFWWSWNPYSWEIFADLNPEVWEKTDHNPIETLKQTSRQRLDNLLKDSIYMRLYKAVMTDFDNYMAKPFESFGALSVDKPLAYFSTEYGISQCLTIYSGGLGVLSGDHLKSASDLRIPLVGVGLLYKNGYFRQELDKDGRQVAYYPENDFASLPVTLVRDDKGNALEVEVYLPGRTLYAQIWKVSVGRIMLYLMDTDIPKNTMDDRKVTARLYEADRDIRLRQEILLGMGGVKALDVLGISPAAYHMNEGHSAFLILERIKKLVEEGLSFAEAGEFVRGSSLFTTHTPIEAGNETFALDKVKYYFAGYAQNVGLSWSEFVALGQFDNNERYVFDMTVLALKYSLKANGVSRLHGYVSRNMWKQGWKNLPTAEVPIGHVTNGIHVGTHAGAALRMLLYRELGEDWMERDPSDEVWHEIDEIDDNQLWAAKYIQKSVLINKIKEGLPSIFKKFNVPYGAQKEVLAHLTPNALIIGFARRFAPYKRANLLFADADRLARILSDESRPIIFVFAGKAHPADTQGIDIMQQVIRYSLEPRFRGKVFFIEDYDLGVSRAMVQGCDVWLNTPRRPYEASGTSGQKVPVNAGLNLSISDGWWCEGYNGENGWTIGPVAPYNELTVQSDFYDAVSLYTLLEDNVIPTYFSRSSDGIPKSWLGMVKNSMKSLISQFSAARMVGDYLRDYYIPAAERSGELSENNKELARRLANWKGSVGSRFNTVKIDGIVLDGVESDNSLLTHQPISIKVDVDPGDMLPEELQVEFVMGLGEGQEFMGRPGICTLTKVNSSRRRITYAGQCSVEKEGKHIYGIRVFPVTKGLYSPLETHLVLWG